VIKTEYEDMRQVDIQFEAGNSDQTIFPVFYAVENREEECVQIFRCRVGLPPTQLPSWLRPIQFDLITHVREGFQFVDYNASDIKPNTPEAEFFLYKVYAEIFFHEMRRRGDSFPEC
jgi:hypothetical protein